MRSHRGSSLCREHLRICRTSLCVLAQFNGAADPCKEPKTSRAHTSTFAAVMPNGRRPLIALEISGQQQVDTCTNLSRVANVDADSTALKLAQERIRLSWCLSSCALFFFAQPSHSHLPRSRAYPRAISPRFKGIVLSHYFPAHFQPLISELSIPYSYAWRRHPIWRSRNSSFA